MRKLKKIQTVNSPLPLEQGVACPSLIQLERKKSDNSKNYSAEELLNVGVVIFACLCERTGSQIVLQRSFSDAKARLKGTKYDEEKLNYMLKKYAELAEASRQTNPLVQIGFF